jgi:hypothetical protein
MKRPNDNATGDLVISGNQLGIGTTDNLSTLTVRARGSFNLTGTLAKTAGSATVAGTGTKFLSELNIGDRIQVPQDEWDNTKAVVAIASDTSLTVESPFLVTSSGLTTVALPSSARFDDALGNPQVIVNDQGNIGIGTTAPQGQLVVSGTGAGDLDGCPIGINVHMLQVSDAWPLVMSTEADGGATTGMALWVTQMGNDGGATLTFSVFQDGNVTLQDFLTIDGYGLHLNACQFTSVPGGISQDYTIGTGDHYLLADAGANGITITLPAVAASIGRTLLIIKVAGAGVVTVAPAATEKINGSTAATTISGLYAALQLICDGVTWLAQVVKAPSSPVTTNQDYTIAPTDEYVYVDATDAGRTVTLPASSVSGGRVIRVFKTDATTNTVTIAPASADTINGAASSKTITAAYAGIELVARAGSATNWVALALQTA